MTLIGRAAKQKSHHGDAEARRERQNPFTADERGWSRIVQEIRLDRWRPVSVLTLIGDSDRDLLLIKAVHQLFNLFWLHRHSGKTAKAKRQADYQSPQQV